jgi:putative ABC transport system permease protein
VINEALARSLGWDEPVGRRLDISGELTPGIVIGVVRDFHFQSMQLAIAPLAFYYAPRGANLSVRVTPEDLPGTLAFLQQTWERFDTAYPFTYSFLDQRFARFYQSERRLMQTLGIFTGLAILIACLGLFGLASYMAEQRTKEIGVRKVLGATVAQIAFMFIKEFAVLVVLALVVAAPVAYFGAERWLQNYAYRVDVGVGLFLLAGAATLALALLTVSLQSIRAALADPVKALRYE